MDIKVQLQSLCNIGSLKANYSLIFGDCFKVTGIKVRETGRGLFVCMPSEKLASKDEKGNANYRDVAYPITKEARYEINKLVLEQYQKDLQKANHTEKVFQETHENDYEMEI